MRPRTLSRNATAPITFDTQLENFETAPERGSLHVQARRIFCARLRLKNCLPPWRKYPDARLIAGATELGLDITKRYQKFPTLISIEAIPELSAMTSTETEWTVGAATTLTRLDEKIGDEYPELRDMLLVFGSRQIRNRATLGGNLVTASPIGDSAPVLLALDAKVVLASATDERVLPLDEFFIDYRKTALQPGEILKSVIVPRLRLTSHGGESSTRFRSAAKWTSARSRPVLPMRMARRNHCSMRASRSAASLPCRRERVRRSALCRERNGMKQRCARSCRYSNGSSSQSPMCAAARVIGGD